MNLLDRLNNSDNYSKNKVIKSILVSIDFQNKIKNPLITIAIPTYKRPFFLKQAIDSALNQYDPICEYEVIVVDNEAEFSYETDTEKLLKTYTDSRLIYFKNEKNLGMFGNINRCIELARGKWVAFLHDDDLLKSSYINKIIKLLNKKPNAGGIIANYKKLWNNVLPENYEKSKFFTKICNYFIRNKLVKKHAIESVIWNTNQYKAPSCGTILNKNIAIAEGGINEDLFPSSDWFFIFKINMKYEVYQSVEYLGYYRVLINETLKIETIKKFIVDKFYFREYSKKNYLIGKLVYMLFRYEQHYLAIYSGLVLDQSKLIKPKDFDYLCKYKMRPIRFFLFTSLREFYKYLKIFIAIIRG